jgi:hypothetical protein
MDDRNKLYESFSRIDTKAGADIECKGMARVVRRQSGRWRIQVDELHNKVLFHPLIAGASIYLTEVMARVDSSIGSALIMVAVGLALELYRKLTRRPCCVG